MLNNILEDQFISSKSSISRSLLSIIARTAVLFQLFNRFIKVILLEKLDSDISEENFLKLNIGLSVTLL